MPLPLSLALVWCGTEWLRSEVLVAGFPLAALEHSQYCVPVVIQCVDLVGQQGLGFAIVLASACAAESFVWLRRFFTATRRGSELSAALIRIGVSVVVVAGVVVYGCHRMKNSKTDDADGPRRRIAILQSSTPLNAGQPHDSAAFLECRELARRHGAGADLVVWPESVCELQWNLFEEGFVPAAWRWQSQQRINSVMYRARREAQEPLIRLASEIGAPVLLNATVRLRRANRELPDVMTNSLLLVDPHFGVVHRYDKTKLTPLVECDIGRLMLGRDLFSKSKFDAGTDTEAVFEIPTGQRPGKSMPQDHSGRICAAVNICYDSLFPRLIRRQIDNWRRRGDEVDVLISVSNDMDSRYRAYISMRFAVHVFRAVENRKTCLVASNCGISGWIDCYGRQVKVGTAGTSTCLDVQICPTREWCANAVIGELFPQFSGLFAWGILPAMEAARWIRRVRSKTMGTFRALPSR